MMPDNGYNPSSLTFFIGHIQGPIQVISLKVKKLTFLGAFVRIRSLNSWEFIFAQALGSDGIVKSQKSVIPAKAGIHNALK